VPLGRAFILLDSLSTTRVMVGWASRSWWALPVMGCDSRGTANEGKANWVPELG